MNKKRVLHRGGMMTYVAMYLLAIVAANLIVARLGPAASIWTAFLFIGLDLTARDKLHDVWNGRGLVWKMAALIAAGSALTVIINWGAWQIAAASAVAFFLAATIDALVYHRLLDKPRWARINGSNIFSAAADSIAFPVLAFGWSPLWEICGGQFVAKVAGGAIWIVVLGGISVFVKQLRARRAA